MLNLGTIGTIFFISLGITFILCVLLVYHFKNRISFFEKKSDVIVDIINNITNEISSIKKQIIQKTFGGVGVGSVTAPSSTCFSPPAYSFNPDITIQKQNTPPTKYPNMFDCTYREEDDEDEEDEEDEDEDEVEDEVEQDEDEDKPEEKRPIETTVENSMELKEIDIDNIYPSSTNELPFQLRLSSNVKETTEETIYRRQAEQEQEEQFQNMLSALEKTLTLGTSGFTEMPIHSFMEFDMMNISSSMEEFHNGVNQPIQIIMMNHQTSQPDISHEIEELTETEPVTNDIRPDLPDLPDLQPVEIMKEEDETRTEDTERISIVEKSAYSKMNVGSLRAIATEKGLCEDASKLKKKELLHLLQSRESISID